MFKNIFPKNHAIYKTMWRNVVEPYGPQKTTRHMCIACWIPKAKNTHSEYVILIAFSLQQLLHEHATMLFYTYRVNHGNLTSFEWVVLSR